MSSEVVPFAGNVPVAAFERETSVAAVAAQAKASVEARYLMALRNPRDIDVFREKLLKECKRPFFAEVARYRKPIGGGAVEGPSIRFVETALRCFTNVLRETPTVYEDDEKRIVRASVTDLEANVTHWTDVTVAKTVERRKVKDGHEVLGQRENSSGETVYIVRATDDELLTKTNALISKAVRNMGLNILPGDIVEEAQHFCVKTRQAKDAEDPDAARLKIVDAFSTVGVKVVDLVAYVGHSLDTLSPAELESLRKDFAALKDGETSWTELVEARGKLSADKKAADRAIDVLDSKDIAKVKAKATESGARHSAPAEIVLADVLGLDDPKDLDMALSGVAKADLPKLLVSLTKWAPKGEQGALA